MTGISETQVEAGGLSFGALVAGPESGPLALCLHGFPDTAHTYRHLLPELAAAGFRAVAPFSRGYAPTDVPADGRYQTGALARDANALHEALGGDERAVIVGHDWGAQATYGAAGSAPDRWRQVVAMAVPVGPALAGSFFSYDQIKRSFYMYFFQNPLAEVLVAADDQAFLARLWADWSPGYDATEDLAHVRESLAGPGRRRAALRYYRNNLQGGLRAGFTLRPGAPVLYLHGEQDGCMQADIATRFPETLPAGSRYERLAGVGHFLQLEDPERVHRLVDEWLGEP
ncbi:MAG: Pimeloyl-ACP methyl ester carboxylesterase [Frankiales bacterium]|nr:Pimeloyl-ACP methyl ester carboxylesterase [Frankiales bacterium]